MKPVDHTSHPFPLNKAKHEFNLEVAQEPARGMWFVRDNENPEAGVLYGPVEKKAVALAWIDGFNSRDEVDE